MGRSTLLSGLTVPTAAYFQAAEASMSSGSQQLSFSSEELLQVASRSLRILLSLGGQPILHSLLRAKVLLCEDEGSEASKCLFELAMLSLAEHQLVVRHGFGGGCTALYSVPAAATARAEEVAYREFPDDSRFVCSVRSVAARVTCSLSRRHGSPRQLAGRARGVEKARARSKRSVGDDASQLQKRTRTDSSDSGYAPMSP